MRAILLYWFAVQQQTSTLWRQKIGLFYMKFNEEFNELSLFFWRKKTKAKVVRKNANWRRSEAKG